MLKLTLSVNDQFKGGLYLKAVFPPLNLCLMGISRSRFKQYKNSMLISQMFCGDL